MNSDQINNTFRSACSSGDTNLAHNMLKKGSTETRSGFLNAAFKGHILIVRMLIRFHSEKKLILNKEDFLCALEFACGRGHLDVVKLLLDNGAEISQFTLKNAYSSGSKEMINLILEKSVQLKINQVENRLLHLKM